MRTFPTSRRLVVGGLTVLAGLLLAASAQPAAADDGVARVTDQTSVIGISHSEPCVTETGPQCHHGHSHGACTKGCGPNCTCGTACQCSGGCNSGATCGPDSSCHHCNSGHCNSGDCNCKNGVCGPGGSTCCCGPACECGKCGSGLSKLFGGKSSKNCRCGPDCQCDQRCLKLCGGKGCPAYCDLNGDGYADPIGNGVCRGCGAHGALFGHGYCGHCCGGVGCCLPGASFLGIPCLGFPYLGIPCLCGGPGGGCFGLGDRPRGALGGRYARVYAVNPYYHDFRDGAVYAAQGYNAPIAVPLAPNVDYQYNYGWGIPSSRITPISRVVPSPYGPQPQYAVPHGYVPAGGAPVDAETEIDGNAAETES